MLAHNSWIHQTDTQNLKLEWTSPGKHYQTKNNKQKWKINKISPMIIQGVTWYYDFIIYAGTMVIRQGEVNPLLKRTTTLSTFQTLRFPAWYGSHVVRIFVFSNFPKSISNQKPYQKPQQNPSLKPPKNPVTCCHRKILVLLAWEVAWKSNGKQQFHRAKAQEGLDSKRPGDCSKTVGGKLDLPWWICIPFWCWVEMQTQQLMR